MHIFFRKLSEMSLNHQIHVLVCFLVFQSRTSDSIRGFVRPSVGQLIGWSVGRSVVIELESVKTRISAPAHPSATGIGRVSGLVPVLNYF